jgi:hypothetical protein
VVELVVVPVQTGTNGRRRGRCQCLKRPVPFYDPPNPSTTLPRRNSMFISIPKPGFGGTFNVPPLLSSGSMMNGL